MGTIKNITKDFEFSKEIEVILIKKVKETDNHPFFKNKEAASMVMKIWHETKSDEFERYIYKHLNTKENIFAFIKSFPDIWNRTINGIFKKEDFQYITDSLKLDSSLIFEKIKEFIPEISYIDNAEDIKVDWEEHNNNSALQNVQQFCYWHLIEEQQNEINKKSFPGPPPSVT